jgi:hypothetical protein
LVCAIWIAELIPSLFPLITVPVLIVSEAMVRSAGRLLFSVWQHRLRLVAGYRLSATHAGRNERAGGQHDRVESLTDDDRAPPDLIEEDLGVRGREELGTAGIQSGRPRAAHRVLSIFRVHDKEVNSPPAPDQFANRGSNRLHDRVLGMSPEVVAEPECDPDRVVIGIDSTRQPFG